jgi:hypothetical protein
MPYFQPLAAARRVVWRVGLSRLNQLIRTAVLMHRAVRAIDPPRGRTNLEHGVSTAGCGVENAFHFVGGATTNSGVSVTPALMEFAIKQ